MDHLKHVEELNIFYINICVAFLGLNIGYMLRFNRKKEQGVHPVHVGDKLLYVGMV